MVSRVHSMELIKLMARKQMLKAMHTMLEETFAKPQLEATDFDWLERLLNELRDRINGLTPNNNRYQEEFTVAFDVDLIMQMLRHDAFDAEEKEKYCTMIFTRLLSLCAPAHDEQVKGIQRTVKSANIGCLIYEANQLIDQIEFLQAEFERAVREKRVNIPTDS